MLDIQLKLKECITIKDILNKQRGSIHLMSNSLKRNTISESFNHEPSNYERKLFQKKFSRKDLSEMLNVMFLKGTIALPDRNFLRRIMLQIFDEEMIHSGTIDFVFHLNLWQYERGDIIKCNSSQYFYFILKGSIQIHAGGFQYKKKQGQTFGQLQILSNESIQHFKVKTSCILLVLTKENFLKYFKGYFQKQYKLKQALVNNIKHSYLDKIPKINKLHFLNTIKINILNTCDKITDKAHQVDKLYFLNNYKGSLIQFCLCYTLGLHQIIKGKANYIQTVSSVDMQYQVPYVSVQDFNKYVVSNFVQQNRSLYNKTKLLNLSNSVVGNPEGTSKIKEMRIRKIRLNFSQKIKTQPHRQKCEFKFFKELQTTSKINPSIHIKLMKHRLSQKNGIKERIINM